MKPDWRPRDAMQGCSQAEAEEAAASSDFGPACVRNDELII